MCTVTFLPTPNGIIITSNRDEQVARKPAAMPEAVDFPSGKILFPKDGQASGTWIAEHSNGNVMVLLNGAFQKHVPTYPYRKSRGLIFLDIFDCDQPIEQFYATDLENIEPFTLVIWQSNNLFEAKWDGKDKYCIGHVTTVPHIWQSVTLYDEEIRIKREQWFWQWLETTGTVDAAQTRQFHEFGGDGDETNALKVNRGGILKTVSITSITIQPRVSIIFYKDLLANISSVSEWYFSHQLHPNDSKTDLPIPGKVN